MIMSSAHRGYINDLTFNFYLWSVFLSVLCSVSTNAPELSSQLLWLQSNQSVFCCQLNVLMLQFCQASAKLMLSLHSDCLFKALAHYYVRYSCQWHKHTNDQPVCYHIFAHTNCVANECKLIRWMNYSNK